MITAYWSKELPNFGDVMSAKLIEFVLKKEVGWSAVDAAQLIGLGSILNMAIHKINTKQKTKQNTAAVQKSLIWGSGLMAHFTALSLNRSSLTTPHWVCASVRISSDVI